MGLLVALMMVGAVDVADVESVAVVRADADVVDVEDRVVAAAGAAIGGGAGGFVGGALALGFSAALSGLDPRASLLPLIVLPPVMAGAAAFVTGTAVSDVNVGWAGAAGASAMTTTWAVVLGILLVRNQDGLLFDRFDATFAAAALVPAVAGVVGAAAVAPWFAPPIE